ncbi:MAG: sulfotransferase, partial [Cyclobacteriaceae bacterium]|nr:sulfotransferase [Cyclobacteriaceae bacterium]
MNELPDDIILNANQSLKELEQSCISRFSDPKGPVFFIVGAPRSGTTVLLQTIINHFELGYINNFIAKFWEAPVVGAAFFQSISRSGKELSYQSEGGSTWDIYGPHEFGYFWKRFFKYGETNVLDKNEHEQIDAATLNREIAGMENIFGRPMIFKNPAALSLQIDFLSRYIPNSYFIYIRRDPFFTAQSLYLKRIEKFNDAG